MRSVSPRSASGGSTEDLSRAQEALAKVSEAFEGMFLKQLVAAGREGGMGKGLFQDDVAMHVMTDMEDSVVARAMASGGGIGVGEAVYRALSSSVLGTGKPLPADPRLAGIIKAQQDRNARGAVKAARALDASKGP